MMILCDYHNSYVQIYWYDRSNGNRVYGKVRKLWEIRFKYTVGEVIKLDFLRILKLTVIWKYERMPVIMKIYKKPNSRI